MSSLAVTLLNMSKNRQLKNASNRHCNENPKMGYHHGDLQQVLMAEAAKIIREEGEAALSMRKLAIRTGVSRTAPYHHFKDKQGLLCAIAEEGFRRFDLIIESTTEEDDLLQHLHRKMRDHVNFATDHPEYYNLMFSSRIWTSTDISQSLKEKAYESFHVYTDSVSRSCQQAQLPDGVTSLRIAQLSWSTFHGLSRLMIDGIYLDKTAFEAIFETVSQLLEPLVKQP